MIDECGIKQIVELESLDEHKWKFALVTCDFVSSPTKTNRHAGYFRDWTIEEFENTKIFKTACNCLCTRIGENEFQVLCDNEIIKCKSIIRSLPNYPKISNIECKL